MTKTQHYPSTSNSPNLPEIEEQMIAFWQKEHVFENSVEQRPQDNEWVFYDGPPFANGLPHYGHLLTSCVKDMFARYHTMKGQKVERRFGWDCHGLPAEMEAEKELKVSGRAAIEQYGIDNFNQHCRSSVMKYTDVWQDYINRAGRWVDFDNDYKTMDKDYMESVIWAFNELYKKGLVYESHRVMPYSWAAQTPLSNFETRMDDAYRDREDKAITVAFELEEVPAAVKEHFNDVEKVYICAWTTTPWTLPSNLALAVSPEMEYVCVMSSSCGTQSVSTGSMDSAQAKASQNDAKGKTCYILAKSSLNIYSKELLELDTFSYGEDLNDAAKKSTDKALLIEKIKSELLSFKGSELVGRHYKPLFPYFKDTPNAFKILAGDFIEEGSGTGVVHLAPGFGEDDQRVCAENGIGIICPVDEAGRFSEEIYDIEHDGVHLQLGGLNVIAETLKTDTDPFNDKQIEKNGLANLRIIHYLKNTGQLIKQEDYVHSYPHCWRTDQPLIYKAMPSWYVEVTKFKDRMVELNQKINWIPNHIKDGQFGKWLEGARDWSISRNRFWGCPIPIWRTESGKTKSFGSIKEMEEFFGVTIEDLHKPFIDTLTKEEEGETWQRVPDVFDCWFESGSMPFAQVHYPFENQDWFESHNPADFIVEYVGQTRGWFYTLMVLSTALFDREPFKNCICHGIILDAEGKKLSKRLRNYPDPNEMFNLYGADAMRWRMVSEPVMHGGNLLISKDGADIRDVVRLNIKPIWNAYHFFTLYANTDGVKARWCVDSDNLMDRYILAKLKQTVLAIEKAMDGFDTPNACHALTEFFEVLNNWYIRRNRDRFWSAMGENDHDKYAAYNTLYTVLSKICRAAAPLLPMTMEAIYQGLNSGGELAQENSVHLQKFADVSKIPDEARLMLDMDRVRDVCNAGLAIRDKENIRIRQPLDKITIYGTKEDDLEIKDFADLIADELNIKMVAFSSELDIIASHKLNINFPVAGKRLGAKMKQVAGAARQGDWSEVGGVVTSGGEVLEEGEYNILLEAKDNKGAQAISTNDMLVVLDLHISDELRAEGLARDVVRFIQQARKDADLNVADKIKVYIDASENVVSAIDINRSYICEQTLAESINASLSSSATYVAENELDGKKITIGLKIA